MKITNRFFTYTLMILALAFTSCSSEDGANGTDGVNGEQGIAGTDGNANVQIIDFDTSTVTNSSIQLFMPELLTPEFLKNHVFLAYAIKGDIHYHMPGPILGTAFTDGSTTLTRVITREGQIIIHFYDWDGKGVTIEERVGWPIDKIRIVFIEATSTESMAGKGISSSEQVKAELETAGINVNDYYAVCEYFGVCEA